MRVKPPRFPGVLGVIPARYASVRLPGKPLLNLAGRTMIEWVYRAAERALDRVVVATDDRRIADAVSAFGGEAVMTPASCASGTDRMAHVARRIDARYYVNVQGDEPLMQPETIAAAVRLAIEKRAIATAAMPIPAADMQNPNAVKVVLDREGRALYFSRAPIPFPRDPGTRFQALKHLGLYVYPKADLLSFVKLKPTALESIEKLEQLRALYHGMPIYVAKTPHDSIGVDTPADAKAVAARLKKFRPTFRPRTERS